MRVLTLKQLIAASACTVQIKLFKKHFKKSVEVTEEFAESLAGTFDFEWASRNLLTDTAKAKYDKVCKSDWAEFEKARVSAWAEFEKVRVPAQAELDEVHEPAWDECNKASAAAWDECSKVCAPAWAEFNKVCGPALAKYDEVVIPARALLAKVQARAFARCYITDTDVACS